MSDAMAAAIAEILVLARLTRKLGGRATVAQLAEKTGMKPNKVHSRLRSAAAIGPPGPVGPGGYDKAPRYFASNREMQRVGEATLWSLTQAGVDLLAANPEAPTEPGKE